ncbi:hypothetical protein NDU88_001508 [Pleurodeles waltl]|uniref:Secreted protein n=1 Tax=Pleurodeles waltl TaxID=8319 RepID=A0AAV7SZN7_PLEWA|nr:hypothetical protein NDU88_001508 [Pleurodeles waltl]
MVCASSAPPVCVAPCLLSTEDAREFRTICVSRRGFQSIEGARELCATCDSETALPPRTLCVRPAHGIRKGFLYDCPIPNILVFPCPGRRFREPE